MLFLASRVLVHDLKAHGRLRLLEQLQERDFVPLIRSTRLRCFGHTLSDPRLVREMEHLLANSVDSAEQLPYLPGDLFCFEDHLFFLLFSDLEDRASGVRAGIVYDPQTTEPLRKLGTFCQTIQTCLEDGANRLDETEAFGEMALTAWRADPVPVHGGFMRFVAKQDADSLSTIVCRENDRERVRAAKLLEDDYTRFFLRRAREAYAEGFSVSPATDETSIQSDSTVRKMIEVGLLRREVLVTCRKSGHTLFSLPSADALAVVTISQAKCSECRAAIADEKVEEVLAPTQLASRLLEDGAWLVNRLHCLLRAFGIPESEIAIEPPAGDGEARIMARVCGESFLIAMRDGDLTPAFARRAIDARIEADARHLVVVVTGTVHNEGRMSLLSLAKRLERGGNDFELIIAEGVNAASAELERAFNKASQNALADQLCELDASLGMSVPRLITTRFQMLRNPTNTAQPSQSSALAEHVQGLHHTAHATSSLDSNAS